MIDELNAALTSYRSKWQHMLENRHNTAFFAEQLPIAVAWKVVDHADLQQKFEQLRNHCDQIHFGWINERWIVTMHLKQTKLSWGISIIKLLQRRPNSKDVVGLDHVDFSADRNSDAQALLASEPNLTWSAETNGKYSSWISLWFDGTEAKLRTTTVLNACIAELQALQDELLDAS